MKLLGFKVNFTGGSLFLAALVGVFSAISYMEMYPLRPEHYYWVAGAITGLGLVLSILLHELGHSIVARRNGIGVEKIDLNLMGGASYLQDRPETPGADFRIAFVGPLTSIGISVVLYGVLYLIGPTIGVGLVAGVLIYLMILNALLAAFNLLPGAPLDGGRVLRAFVWKLTGNWKKSAIFAAMAGQLLGMAIIIFGLWAAYRIGVFTGVWFILIGYQIYQGAGAEKWGIRESYAD